MYEVTIKHPTPTKPDSMTDRAWLSNIARLGFVVGGDWTMGLRSMRAVLRLEPDGRRIADGYITYRAKDSSWAIEKALSAWRTEMRLLLDTEEHDWPYALQVSAKLLPA